MAKKKENKEAKKKDNENVDREKKQEEKVAAANKRKEEEESNAMEVDKEKDMNIIKANDNLETEETGANADAPVTKRPGGRRRGRIGRRIGGTRGQWNRMQTRMKPQYIHPPLDYEG